MKKKSTKKLTLPGLKMKALEYHLDTVTASVENLMRRLNLSEKNVQSLIARVAQEQERYGRLEERCHELLRELSEIERNRPHRKLKRFFRLEK